MDNLLIYFALPIATIILAIVFQKLIRNPLAVAAIFFAIYLIVTFAAFDINFLVLAILYTILAYVTALLTKIIIELVKEHHHCNKHDNNGDNDNILNVSTINTDVLNANTINEDSNNNDSNCRYNRFSGYNRYRRF